MQLRELVKDHVLLNLSIWMEDLLSDPHHEEYEKALSITYKIDYEDELRNTNWELEEINDGEHILIDRLTNKKYGEIRLFDWEQIEDIPLAQEKEYLDQGDYNLQDKWEIDSAIKLLFEEEGIEPEGIETLEYWAVSPFLGEQLQKRGEPVAKIKGTTIWGRQCSGQAVWLDGVMGEVMEHLI